MEKISFISVVYKHSVDMIVNMVTSINNHMQYCPYLDHEIIIIDNYVESELSLDIENVLVIKSGENLGYCGGNNLGITICTGKYIIVINPDVQITNSLAFDWLVGSMKYYKSVQK